MRPSLRDRVACLEMSRDAAMKSRAQTNDRVGRHEKVLEALLNKLGLDLVTEFQVASHGKLSAVKRTE